MKKFAYVLLIITVFCSCKAERKQEEKIDVETELSYREPYRPQYHFSPPEKWMNDPNGLVYNEGIYHLFYQYYPEDIIWGPMHWGHATSKDMVSWEHKPIALYPDEHGLIFSGSAVVDKKNTSGFGNEGETPLVAIYTYHLMEGEKAGRNDFQTQGIAYSLDNGDSWTKYDGNPVIANDGIKDFRDPKVFWHDETQSWIMALVAGDHAKFYRSKDLKNWKYISEFGKDKGAHGGVWECPDLFPLKVEGTNEEKWVLIISMNPGSPNGGSGTQYFIGEFDGTTFSTNQEEVKWLDWGTDNYAGVTYNNTSDNERLFIGWMSNWSYARNTPTEKWRSAMTLPRTLGLKKYGNHFMLKNYPIETLNKQVDGLVHEVSKVGPKDSIIVKVDSLNQTMVRFKTASKDFGLVFKNELDETLNLSMNSIKNEFLLNRMKSGKTDFQVEFGNKIHRMPLKNLPNEAFEVKLYIDWSSIEIFINNGQYVMTQQIFPNEPYNSLTLKNGDGIHDINSFCIEKIKSIWLLD